MRDHIDRSSLFLMKDCSVRRFGVFTGLLLCLAPHPPVSTGCAPLAGPAPSIHPGCVPPTPDRDALASSISARTVSRGRPLGSERNKGFKRFAFDRQLGRQGKPFTSGRTKRELEKETIPVRFNACQSTVLQVRLLPLVSGFQRGRDGHSAHAWIQVFSRVAVATGKNGRATWPDRVEPMPPSVSCHSSPCLSWLFPGETRFKIPSPQTPQFHPILLRRPFPLLPPGYWHWRPIGGRRGVVRRKCVRQCNP